MKYKKILFTIFIALYSVINTGCWDTIELKDLSVVIGMGVDRIPGDEPILITVQLVQHLDTQSESPTGGMGEEPYQVISSKGKTFYAAKQNFSKMWPRKISFAHNKVIIFGKSFSKEGIFEVVDHLERDREIRRTNQILIAKETAREVLESKSAAEILPGEILEKILYRLKEAVITYPIDMNEFTLRLKSEAKTSLAPLVELVNFERDIIQKLEEATGKTVETPKTSEENYKHMAIEKTAIFKNDRLIGILSKDESKGLIWLIGKVKGDVVVIESKETDQEVTLEIIQGKTMIFPKITSEGISIEIKCKGDAALHETENYLIAIKDTEEFKELEKKAELILKDRVEQTIKKAQKDLNADFIGFADHIYNYNPKEWNRIKSDWDNLFPHIKYTVEFDITISNFGLIKNSARENIKKE